MKWPYRWQQTGWYKDARFLLFLLFLFYHNPSSSTYIADILYFTASIAQQQDQPLPCESSTTSYNTFSVNPQQQRRAILPALPAAEMPEQTALFDLKTQSAFTQCPHCLCFVYTKVAGSIVGPCFMVLATAVGALLYFRGDLRGIYISILLLATGLIMAIKFDNIIHSCPNCSRKIAAYNRKTQLIYIAAPALAAPRALNVWKNHCTHIYTATRLDSCNKDHTVIQHFAWNGHCATLDLAYNWWPLIYSFNQMAKATFFIDRVVIYTG